jgi:hypothetical protein
VVVVLKGGCCWSRSPEEGRGGEQRLGRGVADRSVGRGSGRLQGARSAVWKSSRKTSMALWRGRNQALAKKTSLDQGREGGEIARERSPADRGDRRNPRGKFDAGIECSVTNCQDPDGSDEVKSAGTSRDTR